MLDFKIFFREECSFTVVLTQHSLPDRQGASFSKWRAALKIEAGRPSTDAIDINAAELATYASISQARALSHLNEVCDLDMFQWPTFVLQVANLHSIRCSCDRLQT